MNDREGLVLFYDATGGKRWTNDLLWGSEEKLSDWYGITVDEGGHCATLSLNDKLVTIIYFLIILLTL